MSKTLGTNGIIGTQTGDNADRGDVGESFNTSNGTAAVWPVATATFANIDSLTLTAGDWNVTLVVQASLNGATMTQWECGISTTSATAGNYGDAEVASLPPTTAADVAACVPNFRVSLPSTTIVYAILFGTFSAGTPKFRYRLSARRVR